MTPCVLCPVDFSDESLTSLNEAAVIAARSDGRLVALHVADPFLVRAAVGAYHTDIVVQENGRALQEAVEQVRRGLVAHLKLGVHVVVGDPATEICKFCSEHEVDLIVMAHHQFHGYLRLLFGSVTDRVLRVAPAPVLVFPPHCTPHAPRVCVRLDPVATSHV
jgi:nucleotide-binding universal stress UspA family protein